MRAKVFFGGPLTGVIFVLAFAPGAHPILPWFALVPLLHSLDRHGANAPWRAAHGAAAGLLLAAGALHWTPGALPAPLDATWRDVVLSAFASLVLLAAPALACALFALAAGPVLRSRAAAVPLAALPALWTAHEALRGLATSAAGRWAAAELSLGYAVPPSAPEAWVATSVGIHGLSFLAALSGAAFALALRPASLARQAIFAGLGCAVPLALHAWGVLELARALP
ncbi:MAG: hypothetical protein HY721_15125 [Planctomycetes bacterium]|nr:hypothetical protein [Planctomycetota bacterium]